MRRKTFAKKDTKTTKIMSQADLRQNTVERTGNAIGFNGVPVRLGGILRALRGEALLSRQG